MISEFFWNSCDCVCTAGWCTIFSVFINFSHLKPQLLCSQVISGIFQCMCSECAKELRLQSNKCPICRQPIEELMEIKIHNGDR